MRTCFLFVLVLAGAGSSGCDCGGGTGSTVRDAGSGSDGMVADAPTTDAPPADAPPADAPSCPDDDGDGVTTCSGDCDDADPLSAAGLPELCGDGADNDCNGTADDGCTGGLGTFVSAMAGDDANPGTRAMPVRTIGQGMTNAMMLGRPQTVVVAEGTYAEKVTLVEGIDLLGGHHCVTGDCTWARDPATYLSDIRNTDFEGVLAPDGITQATLFEGFHVSGQAGGGVAPGSSGMTLSGCPTIRGNTIVGGDVTGGGFGADRSFGIRIRPTTDPAGILIENNTVTGGTASGSSTALGFDWMGASGSRGLATVRGNVLRGGSSAHSTGVTAWISAAGTLLADNDIAGGPSTGGFTRGIEVGSQMTIDGNRIHTDPATAGACASPMGWCAGIFSESSTTTIVNNVVFGPPGPQSAAVFLGEFETPAGAVIVNGNVLDGGGTPGSTSTRSAALVVSIGTCMTCGFLGRVGHVRNNIMLGGANQNRFGVLEDPSSGRQMHPEILENDLFFFAAAGGRTDVLYRRIGGSGTPTDFTTIAMVNGMTMMPMSAANISGDPLLDATWHTMAGSPAIDAGTATEAPATDFEGDPRPRGSAVDIGADET